MASSAKKDKTTSQYDVVFAADGFELHRDGQAIKTPNSIALRVPTKALAEKIAEEWRARGEKPKPETMPMTQLAMTALDRITPNKDATVASIAAYAESDLLCHRADDPPALIERQKSVWDPWLDWTAKRFSEPDTAEHSDCVPSPLARARRECVEREGLVKTNPNLSSPPLIPPASGGEIPTTISVHGRARLLVGSGIMPIAQSQAALEIFRKVVAGYDPFYLAGLQQAVSVSGSLILGLALAEGKATAAEVFSAAELESLFQMEKWGEDPVTSARHASVKSDLDDCRQWFEGLKNAA